MLVWFAYQSVPVTSIPSNPFPSGLVYIGLATSTSGSTSFHTLDLTSGDYPENIQSSWVIRRGSEGLSKVHPTLSRGMRATR
jgi:hypothetical protein